MKKKTLNSIPKLPTAVQVTWYVCRGLLFIWGAVMLLTGYTTEFLEAVFAIIFTFLWDLFQLLGGKTFITLFPPCADDAQSFDMLRRRRRFYHQ